MRARARCTSFGVTRATAQGRGGARKLGCSVQTTACGASAHQRPSRASLQELFLFSPFLFLCGGMNLFAVAHVIWIFSGWLFLYGVLLVVLLPLPFACLPHLPFCWALDGRGGGDLFCRLFLIVARARLNGGRREMTPWQRWWTNHLQVRPAALEFRSRWKATEGWNQVRSSAVHQHLVDCQISAACCCLRAARPPGVRLALLLKPMTDVAAALRKRCCAVRAAVRAPVVLPGMALVVFIS